MADTVRYDIVTLGETMLRLTPPNHYRIELTRSFDLEVGGSESNVAVGLARLGLRVAWLSRLPRSPLGRLVANTIEGFGVDTHHVAWSDDDRLGLYFLEEGNAPRGTNVLYDRSDSAMSRIRPHDLPAELFTPQGSRQLHLSGITVALSASAAATAKAALDQARAAGWLVSFDLNYRAKLWSPEEARTGCAPFVAAADIVIAPMRDAQTVYGVPSQAPAEDAIRHLVDEFGGADVIMTLGSDGVMAYGPSLAAPCHQPIFPAGGPGRVGGGDAFAAGFFYGYRQDPETPLATGIRWGAAAAAIKHTIPGELPLFELREVAALAEGTGSKAVHR